MSLGYFVVGFFGLFSQVYSATPEQWRSRSIYQIITDRFERNDGNHGYICDPAARVKCGGTWSGIQRNLNYIQGMGFDAIWISPIHKNIEFETLYGDGYAGYYIQDYTQINEHMGSSQDLVNLISELHTRGMYIMVDNVPNHMAGHPLRNQETLSQIDFNGYYPFNKSEYFHTPCRINESDPQSVVNCWLGDDALPLMDLNTDNAFVSNGLNSIVANMTSLFRIDGIRVDAVKHIKHDFWKPYNQAAGVYALGEVFTGDTTVMCPFQHDALDGLLNFGAWGGLMSALTSPYNTMNDLAKAIENINHDCVDSTLLGSFMENQDVARWRAMTQDESLILNTLTFVMMADGIPIIYYGFEQNFKGDSKLDGNREALWTSRFDTDSDYYGRVASLNALRKSISATDNLYLTTHQKVIHYDPRWIAILKSQVVTVVTNLGIMGSTSISIPVPWLDGTIVKEFYSGEQQTISGGTLASTIQNGMPMIWTPVGMTTDAEKLLLSFSATQRGIKTDSLSVNGTARSANKLVSSTWTPTSSEPDATSAQPRNGAGRACRGRSVLALLVVLLATAAST